MKTKKSFLCGAALFLGAALFNQSVQAQLILSGTNYTQTFDAIGGGLPAGWSVRINAATNDLGTVTTNYSADYKSWGDSKGEFGNCASVVSDAGTNFIGNESTQIQSNCLNRALAIRQTTSFGDPGAAFVLQISDTIGMSNLVLKVDLCTLRAYTNITTWAIQYGIGDSPVAFATLGTYANSTNFSATTQIFSLGADASGSSANVWIRIAALSPAAGGGTRATFGIDNFSLSWTTNGIGVVQPSITGITVTNGNIQIDFTGDVADGPAAFKLQCVGHCSDIFGDTAAAITQTSSGHFRALYPMNGAQQFYRIKRP